MPARCQSRSRRQQVIGPPQPSWSVGGGRQGNAGAELVDDAGQRGAVIDAGMGRSVPVPTMY